MKDEQTLIRVNGRWEMVSKREALVFNIRQNWHVYIYKFLCSTTNLIFGSLCGIIVMTGAAGFLVASIIALFLALLIDLWRATQRNQIHPIVFAVVSIVFVILPFILYIQGERIGSPLHFLVHLYRLNISAFILALSPGFNVLHEIANFIAAFFGEYTINMNFVLLASKDWNPTVVGIYHVFLIAPLMLLLFALGYKVYKSKTPKERIVFVICLLVPMLWIYACIKINYQK